MPFELEAAIGYRNLGEFAEAIRNINFYHQALRPPTLSSQIGDALLAAHISHSWMVMENTASSPLGMVMLGRVSESPPPAEPDRIIDSLSGRILNPSTEEYSTLDGFMHANFGTITEHTSGSILWSTNWTILLNDSLILGGIQSNLPFYLVSPRTENNIWVAGNNRLTVTGREIIGPLISGYSISKQRDGTEILRNKSASPRGLSADEYIQAIDYFSRNGNWRILTRPDLYSLDFNFEFNTIRDMVYL